MAKKKTNYSVFIYSEAAPDAKYAIYKHTRKFRVLQYIVVPHKILDAPKFYNCQLVAPGFQILAKTLTTATTTNRQPRMPLNHQQQHN